MKYSSEVSYLQYAEHLVQQKQRNSSESRDFFVDRTGSNDDPADGFFIDNKGNQDEDIPDSDIFSIDRHFHPQTKTFCSILKITDPNDVLFNKTNESFSISDFSGTDTDFSYSTLPSFNPDEVSLSDVDDSLDASKPDLNSSESRDFFVDRTGSNDDPADGFFIDNKGNQVEDIPDSDIFSIDRHFHPQTKTFCSILKITDPNDVLFNKTNESFSISDFSGTDTDFSSTLPSFNPDEVSLSDVDDSLDASKPDLNSSESRGFVVDRTGSNDDPADGFFIDIKGNQDEDIPDSDIFFH
ncbi:hypothetical protein JTE90_014830 [Oedothorax gibbosus]|uniref:Uncharacterized protein n=1 Tax=Oedothorax gibbosus TaxID=931172 RepID=A0AAV6TSR8_9ARAC|nr:hypothetical protein JTE90_014830 [Oedothorax gibbosus]